MITLYVLRSQTGARRYVGITKDLKRRLAEHRNKSTKGGQVLGEFDLLHAEPFPDYSSARMREKFLKSGKGREWLNTKYAGSGANMKVKIGPPEAGKARP